jgi:hypothetical protein
MGLVNILIKVIPHAQQRYDTVGDWIFQGDTLFITISDMGDDRYNQLVGYHEYIEAILCKAAGIKEEDVTAFDIKFEEWRASGNVGAFDEPGNHNASPYYQQHQIATQYEMLLARELGVDWDAYDEAVNSL